MSHSTHVGFTRPSIAGSPTNKVITVSKFGGLRGASANASRVILEDIALHARGVGQNPHSLSDLGSAGISRAQHSPFRIVPQRGQVSEYDSEPPRSEYWRVFHECESRSYLANNPSHLRPETRSCTVESFAFPGCADVLAGEPAGNDVNASAPWLAVEGAHIIPDGELGKVSVSLPGKEHSPRVVSKFDSADGTVPEDEVSEDAAACPGKKVQASKFSSR